MTSSSPILHAARAMLVALLCLLWTVSVSASEVQVKWVPDGDTIHLQDGNRVRLLGIDAPEMGRDGGPDQYYARESRDYLRRLIDGRSVRLETDGQEPDRYGRLLAYVFLPDGRMANEVLVEEGLAFFYPHSHQDREFQRRMLEAQKRAIMARKGFWPRILSLPQPPTGWMGNRRSKRFHHPESHYAARISPKNRVALFSLEQAFLEGYAPARTSSPWPDAD
ncbi:thermonuclease family protein [Desulfonatronum lacustre]|uniref:thermonuclease family protein n=1 Tax=Desulfonatronum lacustre TaxID=66849 RepID=UPI0004922070|nr:thermonuclease family protein [Desulfonatronum lacustre]SMP42037.1 micrococcal nuclease [Desulfonatronum zhilinae]